MPLIPDIPTVLSHATPLFALARKGLAEVAIAGVAYVKVEGEKIIGNDPTVMLAGRSLMKPWQFLAADVAGDEPHWALGLASHSGQPHHLEQLRKLCEIAGAGEDELF